MSPNCSFYTGTNYYQQSILLPLSDTLWSVYLLFVVRETNLVDFYSKFFHPKFAFRWLSSFKQQTSFKLDPML